MGARACRVRRSPARRPRVFWRFRAGAGTAAGSRGYWAGVFRALCVRRPGESVGRYRRSRSRSRSVRSAASRRQRNWSATRACYRACTSRARARASDDCRRRARRLPETAPCGPAAPRRPMRLGYASLLVIEQPDSRCRAGRRPRQHPARCSGARYSRSASSWARTRASTFSGWRTWLWRRWRLAAAALGKRAGQNWQA
jgi:hypothetical protein